jgi:glycosyltransferase involved in cell wall biosynthesis
MRLVCLAPPSPRADRLVAHSFVEEEIVALRAAGAEPVVVSDAAVEPRSVGGVAIVPVPPSPPPREIAAVLRLAMRHAAMLPAGMYLKPDLLIHAMRIELAAARVARAIGAGLIHSHFGWPAGLGGTIAAAAARIPLVASLRGMDLLVASEFDYGLRRDAAYDAAIRRMLRAATATLYATEYMRVHGVAAGAHADRAIVIRKGVDLERFRPADDREAARGGAGLDGPMVLAVSTLQPRKNIARLVTAMSSIRGAPWTLVVCGDGPERDTIASCAAAHGLSNRVRLEGQVPRERIAAYFAAADVFVHAAAHEAAGNVVLEAQAAGCPVVCVGGSGPEEYVRDGETGFVVRSGSLDDFAARVALVLGDAALRARMSREARAAAELSHAYPRMVNELLDVYRRATARRIDAAEATAVV